MQLRLTTYTKKMRVERFVFLTLFILLINGCNTPPIVRGPPPSPVNLPFLRLEQAGECYFIDDFMPTPNSLVSGKTSSLFLRYYTYWNARYKYWSDVGVMLAFYSRDMRCWALFEEYALPKIEN